MAEADAVANRRSSPRKKPKATTKLYCVTGKLGLGANVAVSLLDVSETGIRMVVKRSLQAGHEVEVGLESIVGRRPVKIAANIVWCAALADGNFCVGAHFQKPLDYALLQTLAYF